MLFRKNRKSPESMSLELRERALTASPGELGLAADCDTSGAWLAAMETGHVGAAATLVCVIDGTTSVYMSNGGGMIGAGEHDSVRAATARFLSVAAHYAPRMRQVTEHPLPEFNEVRFFVRAGDRLLAASNTMDTLSTGKHPLSAFFLAGQLVITAIRETGVFT
ncbi:MAG: hypothetical protein JWM95_1209 [Gemmatimonadetes bacterium]|nr:hypothetical protein [Gemmatimonadota bacterium]